MGRACDGRGGSTGHRDRGGARGGDEAKLARAAATLRDEGARVSTAAFDVTQGAACAAAVERIEAEFAPIAEALTKNEAKIVEELLAVQGQAVDIGAQPSVAPKKPPVPR